jgi:hypothetical protein
MGDVVNRFQEVGEDRRQRQNGLEGLIIKPLDKAVFIKGIPK